ncbi:hypothetical protein E2C01_003035 [Portunus trituberculatus]|uniref:Uncharacterized protein n=1 Tax=Portunus trituberculatus TaxID=210409 RepID=A0A5B7CLU8_PORTR|nr:hypothetical protein [Portunus trituberculatus]
MVNTPRVCSQSCCHRPSPAPPRSAFTATALLVRGTVSVRLSRYICLTYHHPNLMPAALYRRPSNGQGLLQDSC